MRVMRVCAILVLASLLAALAPSASRAAPSFQGQNLLVNPGFEEPYDKIGRGERAHGWGHWFETTGHEGDFAVSIERNPAVIHSGSAAQHIGNRTYAWYAGVWQTVAVPAGTQVRFCAWGRVFVSNDDWERVDPPGYSWDGHNARGRVGISPNGEEEWNNPAVVWSPEANPHNWQQLCVDAVAGPAGKVKVWTSFDLRSAAQAGGVLAFHVDGWWDDASLVALGTAAAATAPAAGNTPTGAQPPAQAATAAPVTCETRPDGSVVRVVQSGDSLLAIALACDSTVEAIQQLNGLSGTLINVGQTLIVKGPTAAPTATPAPTQAATPTALASPTPTDGQVCVEAFNDANANQAKDTGEQLLGGVGFTLSDTSGPKNSYVTSGLEREPYCFAGLTPGTYTVEARAPNGVTSTTDSKWQVGLTAGLQHKIAYGGSRGAAPTAAPGQVDVPAPSGSDSSPSAGSESSSLGRIALGGLGVLILLVAGFMAGLVVMRSRR